MLLLFSSIPPVEGRARPGSRGDENEARSRGPPRPLKDLRVVPRRRRGRRSLPREDGGPPT
eukprot:5508518-Pyramimonas_sp.AAC.1